MTFDTHANNKEHGDEETLIKINNSLKRLPDTEPYKIVREKLLKHKLTLEERLKEIKVLCS